MPRAVEDDFGPRAALVRRCYAARRPRARPAHRSGVPPERLGELPGLRGGRGALQAAEGEAVGGSAPQPPLPAGARALHGVLPAGQPRCRGGPAVALLARQRALHRPLVWEGPHGQQDRVSRCEKAVESWRNGVDR